MDVVVLSFVPSAVSSSAGWRDPNIHVWTGSAGNGVPVLRHCKPGTWAGSVLDGGFRWETRSSMNCAGGSQKKRKAAVREESAETQEYEPCKQNFTEVDEDKGRRR